MRALSAVIITKNEEKNIARCIKSVLPIADEVLVVDSYSTDKTKEICESYKIRFSQQAWMGYAKTKNIANAIASHDWILSLDADEALSPELQQSILRAKHDPASFFSFRRLNNYCGKWIKHSGWYPDIKPRLFDRREAEWQGDYVHETLVHKGGKEPVLLEGDCLHYTYTTIKEHSDKAAHYAQLSVEEHFRKGKRFSLFKMIFNPWFGFIKVYFLKLGFLDGIYGFIIAVIYAYTRFLRYAALYRLEQQAKDRP